MDIDSSFIFRFSKIFSLLFKVLNRYAHKYKVEIEGYNIANHSQSGWLTEKFYRNKGIIIEDSKKA